MSCPKGALFSVVWLLFGCLTGGAAPKKAPQIILEDPELYFTFLQSHNSLNYKISNSAPAAAAQASSAGSAVYGVNANDFQILSNEVRKFEVALGAWMQNYEYYRATQRAAKAKPDMHALANLQAQRQRLVMNAHARIRKSMSATGWASLHGYVNGSFKASQARPSGGPK
jgi:hypothetical protein